MHRAHDCVHVGFLVGRHGLDFARARTAALRWLHLRAPESQPVSKQYAPPPDGT
jgi:hypothetical protein